MDKKTSSSAPLPRQARVRAFIFAVLVASTVAGSDAVFKLFSVVHLDEVRTANYFLMTHSNLEICLLLAYSICSILCTLFWAHRLAIRVSLDEAHPRIVHLLLLMVFCGVVLWASQRSFDFQMFAILSLPAIVGFLSAVWTIVFGVWIAMGSAARFVFNALASNGPK